MSLRDPFVEPEDDQVPSVSRAQVSPALRTDTNKVSATATSSTIRPSASSSMQKDPRGSASSSTLSLGIPRNRSTASASAPSASLNRLKSADDAVRQTDSDALLSRISALRLGYLPQEPYTQEFVSSSGSSGIHSIPAAPTPATGPLGYAASRPSIPPGTPLRRSPLINIGTYLRCTTLDTIVQSFLTASSTQKQIISIGAGSDSRYWRIVSRDDLSSQLAHYLEIDFLENTRQKVSSIRRSSKLQSLLGPQPSPSTSDIPGLQQDQVDTIKTPTYSLLPADVRHLHPHATAPVDPEMLFGHLNPQLPTLVLFECVLSYLPPEEADWLIGHLGKRFPDIVIVSYDMCIAGDQDDSQGAPTRFGKVMLQNLEVRNLSLPGAKAYPTIRSQQNRFTNLLNQDGPHPEDGDQQQQHSQSLLTVWQTLPQDEKQRLSRLEGLDEVEELEMLLKHYCIVQVRNVSSQ